MIERTEQAAIGAPPEVRAMSPQFSPWEPIDLAEASQFCDRECSGFGGWRHPNSIPEWIGLSAASDWVRRFEHGLRCRPVAPSGRVVPHTIVAIVGGEQFNARAAVNERYAAVMIRRSALVLLADLFARMVSTAGVFAGVGDTDLCALHGPTLRGPTQSVRDLDNWLIQNDQPAPPFQAQCCDRRRELWVELLAHAARWIAAHEFAHIINGHLGWKSRRGIGPLTKEAQDAWDQAIRTMEWDADAFVINQLFHQILTDQTSPTEDVISRFWACAVAGTSLHLYCCASEQRAEVPLPPHERIESVSQLMHEWIDRKGPSSSARALHNAVTDAMNEVFGAFRLVFSDLLSEEFNWIPPHLRDIAEYEAACVASTKRHAEAWARLYPQLLTVSCWEGLVRPTEALPERRA